MMEEKKDTCSEKSEIGNPLYCSYVDGLYTYKDPRTNNQFVWDDKATRWVPKAVSGGTIEVQFDGQTHTYRDHDGAVYEWDAAKNAWFPQEKGETDLNYSRSEPENCGNPGTNTATSPSSDGFHNPNYDNTLQNQPAAPRRFYYAALSPSEMGVNEPVLFLSPDDQVNNNSTIPQDPSEPPAQPSSSQHALTQDSQSSLPTGWERHEDANGAYYWHIKSGTIQRDTPTIPLPNIPASNPALLIPGSLQSSSPSSSFRRSQTISSQLSSSATSNNSSAANSSSNNSSISTAEKRKSWSQFLENSEHRNNSYTKPPTQPLTNVFNQEKSSLRFVAVNLGCLNILEEDLTPERSSRAVSKVIAELTNPAAKGTYGNGMEVAGKIWGGGGELFLELDESHLRVKAKDRSLTVAEQPIHSIRVWGVGRDDPRDFAYVAREKQSRQFLCHVFRLEMNARPLASALRDACKRIMIERQQKQKRPTTLPTGLRKTSTSNNNPSTAFFPTPMDEPRKVLKAYYLGAKVVNRPTGMDVLNAAIDNLRTNEPLSVSVSVAPSVLVITSDESDNPKLDDEFLVRYQLGYGSNAAVVAIPPHLERPPPGPSTSDEGGNENPLKRKQPSQPQWFDMDETQNTKVYVSNLPLDITDEEFTEFMSKCGLIMKDVASGQYRLKLYEDANGHKKGDGLCTYIKVESVQLALQILDGADIRGHQVKVERAKFTMKGQYDPSKKPKQKKRKEKEKMKKQQDALFAWKPEKLRGERAKHERIVVVSNAFQPPDFDADVGLILEYQQDFREEAGKFGTCKKVVIFDRHPEGIMQIFMSSPEEADAVVTSFNNRFFGGKQLQAALWDGQTKFRVEETDAERDDRLQNWEKFIAEDSANTKPTDSVLDSFPATPPAQDSPE